MLSLTYVSAEQATAYYDVVTRAEEVTLSAAHAEYYVKKPGEWFGRGAGYLGLDGAVSKKHFENVLNGLSKGGRMLIVPGGPDMTHRAGYDWTFSAPKSVSVVAEMVAGDRLKAQIYDAHEEAVREALSYFERNYATARQTVGQRTAVVKTGNLVFATFTENTSRALDPQIHTHCVIANMTRRPDGKWRAIMNEPVHDQKMFIGQVYRNALAKRLERSLGLAVESRPKGIFEITGILERVLLEFSRRSQDIKQSLPELRKQYPGLPEARLKEIAALQTRDSKTSLTATELRPVWRERLTGLGVTPESLRAGMRPPRIGLRYRNDVDLALDVLTGREAVLTREEILRQGLRFSTGRKDIADVERDMSDSKEIRTLEAGQLYTSREMLLLEQGLVKQVQFDAGLTTTEEIGGRQGMPGGQPLTADQVGAVERLLSCDERVMLVQGDAGTGKSTMLQIVANAVRARDHEVVAVAPTGKAAAELRMKGIRAQTIHKYLQEEKQANHASSTRAKWIIIDEASMVGSASLSCVLGRADIQDRIVLVGDHKQLTPVEAGAPFGAFQRNEVLPVSTMTENIRQETPLLRNVVAELNSYNPARAFDLLSDAGKIHEIANAEERLNAVADVAVSKNAIVITDLNQDRDILNARIREKVRTSGMQRHYWPGITVNTLQPVPLDAGDQHAVSSYRVGDVVRVAGKQGKVVSVDSENHTLGVACGVADEVSVDLMKQGKDLTLYREQQKEFARGDRIVFVHNDQSMNVQNSLTGTVLRADWDAVIVRADDLSLKEFDPQKYRDIDHAYALTTYKCQGMTCKNVVYHAPGQKVDYRGMYVATTRARADIEIFTDSKSVLQERVKAIKMKKTTMDYQISVDLLDD